VGFGPLTGVSGEAAAACESVAGVSFRGQLEAQCIVPAKSPRGRGRPSHSTACFPVLYGLHRNVNTPGGVPSRALVAGVAPVAQRVEIAHVEAVFEPGIHPRQAARDLARHKRFTPPRTLVVEQHAIAGVHAIALAVVHRDPVGIELRHAVGAARIEGCALLLRDLLHQAVELTCARLVDPRFLGEPQDPHCLQDPQRAQCVAVGGVLRTLKTHRHMTLGAEVVDLIRLHLLDDPD